QILQKALPIRYYPPHTVDWWELESTGLGRLPHFDEDKFERSDKLMSLKRKNEAKDEQFKRQRVAENRAVEKVRQIVPNFIDSFACFKTVTSRSPAIRRFLTNTVKPRPNFAPSLLTSFAAAQDRACRRADLLAQPLVNPDDPEFIKQTGKMSAEEKQAFIAKQKAERALVSFIPPLSVLTGSQEWSKTAQFVLSAVLMLRLFLKRVVLARTDPAVDRIGTQDWKQVLGGQYFQHVWRTEETARHRREHGDAEEVESRIAQRVAEVESRIAQKYAELRRAEEEDAGEVKGGGKGKKKKRKGKKKEGTEMEDNLTQQQKKELGKEAGKIRQEEEDRGVLHEEYDHARFWKYGGERFFGKAESDRLKANPDAQPELSKLPCGCVPTLDLIKNDPIIVTGVLYLLNQIHLIHWLGNMKASKYFMATQLVSDKTGPHHTLDVLPGHEGYSSHAEQIISAVTGNLRLHWSSWPVTGTPPTAEQHKRSLENFQKMLSFSDHYDTLDKDMEHDKEFWSDFKHRHHRSTLTTLEHEGHLMLRYYLMSFKCGQWPVEFHMRPPEDLFKCRKCRGDERPCETAPQLNPGMTE
ncbi:hypothetical protein PENSPDRAFT_672673, partial [Peniophora sp. CONT]